MAPFKPVTIADTHLTTWFERDRAHVALVRTATDRTLVEWWDEAVGEAIEDGFLKAGWPIKLHERQLHESAFEYWDQHIRQPRRVARKGKKK